MTFDDNTKSLSASTYKDHEPDELGEGALASLPGDDVPLLRGADDDLGADDLIPRQLVVSSQLRHRDVVRRQTLRRTFNS